MAWFSGGVGGSLFGAVREGVAEECDGGNGLCGLKNELQSAEIAIELREIGPERVELVELRRIVAGVIDAAERVPAGRGNAGHLIGEAVKDDGIDAGGEELVGGELHLFGRGLVEGSGPDEGLAAHDGAAVDVSGRGGEFEEVVAAFVVELFGFWDVGIFVDSQDVYGSAVRLGAGEQLVIVRPTIELAVEAFGHELGDGEAIVAADLIADVLDLEEGHFEEPVTGLYGSLDLKDGQEGLEVVAAAALEF